MYSTWRGVTCLPCKPSNSSGYDPCISTCTAGVCEDGRNPGHTFSIQTAHHLSEQHLMSRRAWSHNILHPRTNPSSKNRTGNSLPSHKTTTCMLAVYMQRIKHKLPACRNTESQYSHIEQDRQADFLLLGSNEEVCTGEDLQGENV